MIKTIIVDDERLARKDLHSLLGDFPQVQVLDEASNADEAIEKISKLDPDVVFLDIQMPGKTGFEMLEEMDKVPQPMILSSVEPWFGSTIGNWKTLKSPKPANAL